MSKLTNAKIKSLSLPGMYGDGGTLYLAVARGGSKSWVQRIVVGGKRRELGLGGWPVVSLAEARDAALDNRRLVRKGGDPLAEKGKAKALAAMPTFREAALATFEANKPRLKNAKVIASWMQQLELHAFPKIGDIRIDRVGKDDVLRVLTPLWSTRPEGARKLRERIRSTLAWAEAKGFVDQNVAGDAISGALPSMRTAKKSFRALPHGKVAEALAAIKASGSGPVAKAALRFTILTAARSGEVRGARWGEIDMDARVWRIPGERMKAGKEHRVPLSEAALAVLADMRQYRDEDDGPIFPGARRGAPLSDMTLTKILRTVGLADRATVHGFRSSFRDWCADTGKPREIAEAALAHTVGGVEGAYFRSDLMERRRGVMEAWSHYATGKAAPVHRLRA